MRFYVVFLAAVGLLTSCSVETTHTPVNQPTTSNQPPAPKKTAKTTTKNGLRPLPQENATPVPVTGLQKAHQLEAEGKYLEALHELVTLSVSAPTKTEQDSYRLRAIDIVETKLDDKQLQSVAKDSDDGFLRGYAMFQLGQKSLENHDPSEARKYFSSVIDYLPGSDLAVRSQDLLSQLEAARSVEARTVGVVLPLSGKNAQVAQRALRGLEMGLGLNQPNSKFKLAVMDSEGNPDTARRGVERLVKEDNVIAIVGSLLSKTAPAVATKADELGVPSIGLSQRAGLTEIGPNVFRNSLTSAMQVQQLVRTAMNDLGMKKFAILYPNDAYGVEFANIFWDEVLARGGEITAVQTYSNKETDFRMPVQRLVGTYFGEARQEEFNLRMKELQKQDKKKSARNSNLEDILPPITDFDAIFIPDSAKALGQISAMLAYSDVRGVRLLGTNLWNTPGIAKRAGNAASNLLFVDSFSSNIVNQEQSHFISDYKALFGEEPSLIEIQAYDTGLILRQLVLSGADSREALTKKLTELNKFPGALGPLNISPEREIQRPLVTLTVEKGEIEPLKLQK